MADIPDDVMQAAREALLAEVVATGGEPDLVLAVARAIIGERERSACLADTYFMAWPNDGSAYWLERRKHSTDIAAAIRKGGEA